MPKRKAPSRMVIEIDDTTNEALTRAGKLIGLNRNGFAISQALQAARRMLAEDAKEAGE
jgi:uncharacterized protein (DUF1778 family)